MLRDQMIQKILDLSIRLCDSADAPSTNGDLTREQATELALKSRTYDELAMILTALDW